MTKKQKQKAMRSVRHHIRRALADAEQASLFERSAEHHARAAGNRLYSVIKGPAPEALANQLTEWCRSVEWTDRGALESVATVLGVET